MSSSVRFYVFCEESVSNWMFCLRCWSTFFWMIVLMFFFESSELSEWYEDREETSSPERGLLKPTLELPSEFLFVGRFVWSRAFPCSFFSSLCDLPTALSYFEIA